MVKKIINLFSLLFITLFGLSLTGCGLSVGVYCDADKYLIGNQIYNENISSLDVEWLSGNLILVEDETIDGVKIEEQTNLTDEKELVHSYLKDGILNIKFFASGHSKNGFTTLKKDLTITYHPGISSIDIDITSGNIKAESITADKIDIDMTSGSSNIGKIVSKDVDIDFTSGNVNAQHISVDNLDVDMTSGEMKVGFDDISNASFDITSGKIDMTLPISGGEVKVNKISGIVDTIRQCSVNDNLYKFDDGDANININMTSGTLIIR